jgi:DNA repair protein RadC
MANQSINGLTVPTFIPRYRVCVVPDSRHTGQIVLIHNSASAATALRPFFAGLDREQFIVCCLDAKHAIIGVNLVSIGTLTLSLAHPREVFKPAIPQFLCDHRCPQSPFRRSYPERGGPCSHHTASPGRRTPRHHPP